MKIEVTRPQGSNLINFAAVHCGVTAKTKLSPEDLSAIIAALQKIVDAEITTLEVDLP